MSNVCPVCGSPLVTYEYKDIQPASYCTNKENCTYWRLEEPKAKPLSAKEIIGVILACILICAFMFYGPF